MGRAGAGLVLDLCVGPRSRRSRVPHACHVRVPRPRSPLTHVIHAHHDDFQIRVGESQNSKGSSQVAAVQNLHKTFIPRFPAQVDPCRSRRSARSTPASVRAHTAHDAVCARPLRPLGVPRASKLQGHSVGGAARRRRQSITTIGLRGRTDVLSARNAFPR